MAYKRLTEDQYIVQGNYHFGDGQEVFNFDHNEDFDHNTLDNNGEPE